MEILIAHPGGVTVRGKGGAMQKHSAVTLWNLLASLSRNFIVCYLIHAGSRVVWISGKGWLGHRGWARWRERSVGLRKRLWSGRKETHSPGKERAMLGTWWLRHEECDTSSHLDPEKHRQSGRVRNTGPEGLTLLVNNWICFGKRPLSIEVGHSVIMERIWGCKSYQTWIPTQRPGQRKTSQALGRETALSRHDR